MEYTEQKLSLKRADVIFIKNFYSKEEADTIYDKLSESIIWTQKEYEGRRTALYGTAKEYKYALNVGKPINWNEIPILQDIANKVSIYTNTAFDVCLANYYAD